MPLALVLTRGSKENFSDLAHLNTVQTFLAHQIQVPVLAGGFSNFALRAKASALFDLAAKVASSWNAGEFVLEGLVHFAFHFTRVFSAAGVALTQISEQDTLSVEDSINRFIASIIPVHQMGAIHACDRHNLIVVHTLAQAALIRLYYLRGEVDQLWNEKCLLAARGMLLVIGQVTDMDLEFLDPIVGVRSSEASKSSSLADLKTQCCWASAAHVLMREIAQVESWSPMASNELGNNLGTITTVLSRLSLTFPLAGMGRCDRS